MSSRTQRNLLLAAFIIFLASVSAFVGYIYGRVEDGRQSLSAFYLRHSINAHVLATALLQLRTDDQQNGLRLLDSVLLADLASLKDYERDTGVPDREPIVYRNIAAARSYYERFPQENRSNLATPALELGGEDGGAAP